MSDKNVLDRLSEEQIIDLGNRALNANKISKNLKQHKLRDGKIYTVVAADLNTVTVVRVRGGYR